MYFGIALALMLSRASSASINDDNPVVNSNFLHTTSSITKKGRRFVVSSSNYLKEKELLTSKTIYSAIGSSEIRNSVVENNDHKNKDKTDVLRVISTADSKTFEVCDDFGLINSCSSAEEVCVPLTEQQSLPFSPEDLVTNLTDEEMTELGVCLNLSLIQATNSLQHIGDDASAAATVEDLLYASDRSSIYMKEEDNDQRRGLQSNYDCDSIVCTARPTVTVSGGFDFHHLIRNCIVYPDDGCPANLQGVPLKCWNTAEVSDMRSAFDYLYTFNSPLRCWDTSKVTSMYLMFNYAHSFNQPLDLWDVSKVTTMSYMFQYASSFNQPIESWDVSKVTDMRFMFYKALEFNQCLSTWADKTPNHVITSNLFLGSDCPLQDDPITTEGPWCQDSDICLASEHCEATGRPAVTVTGSDFQKLIYDCYYSGNDVGYDCTGNYCGYSIYSPTGNDCPTEFKDVPLDCWDTSGVDDMSYAFEYINFYQPLESWNVSEVTSMYRMFSGASIFNQPLESWDISKVADMRYMFGYASSFNQPLQSWDVSKATSMNHMFAAAFIFNQPLESWDVSKVADMRYMFTRASSFDQYLEYWDVSKVADMGFMFFGATNFDQLIDSWDVSKVTTMRSMFNGASSFDKPLESWDVSKVTTMWFMFQKAYTFDQPLESWDVSEVTRMSLMFNGASSFNQAIDGWDVSKVSYMGQMFNSASDFNQCLSTWGNKTNDDVINTDMFVDSGCPYNGPWCQSSDICGARGPCTNSEEKFKISKKKSITCTTLESFKKGKRKKICKIKAALESCPVICNMKCTCKDNKTFIFNQKKYKCKKAGRKGQPQCNDDVNEKNKVSDLCPNKCGTCYESE